MNTESHKTNRGRPLAAPYLEDYELNKKLVNHQLTATNTVVELHLHYINTCRHVQFIYVVDTIHVELTYNAAVQINQSSTSQHAVFPVVVDDQYDVCGEGIIYKNSEAEGCGTRWRRNSRSNGCTMILGT